MGKDFRNSNPDDDDTGLTHPRHHPHPHPARIKMRRNHLHVTCPSNYSLETKATIALRNLDAGSRSIPLAGISSGSPDGIEGRRQNSLCVDNDQITTGWSVCAQSHLFQSLFTGYFPSLINDTCSEEDGGVSIKVKNWKPLKEISHYREPLNTQSSAKLRNISSTKTFRHFTHHRYHMDAYRNNNTYRHFQQKLEQQHQQQHTPGVLSKLNCLLLERSPNSICNCTTFMKDRKNKNSRTPP